MGTLHIHTRKVHSEQYFLKNPKNYLTSIFYRLGYVVNLMRLAFDKVFEDPMPFLRSLKDDCHTLGPVIPV